MKTTIDIPDPLLQQIRKMASERKTTIRAIIEAALREQVARGKRPKTRFHLETPSFGGEGLQPGLSWDDWSTITDLSYEGRGS
ncbi:MAG: DUF2191 domain-containing protein [Deltaproteobacteria bacterium]|nr:DUF2191 domain-containing protein [Deltaproteobacteria bacterium]